MKGEGFMKLRKIILALLTVLLTGTVVGCKTIRTNYDSVRWWGKETKDAEIRKKKK